MKRNHFNHSLSLIEDNPVDIDLSIRTFKFRKLRRPIEVMRDSGEALGWINKWQEGEPRSVMILLDLKLSKTHVLSALKLLKSHETLKTIPGVVLSSATEDTDMHTAYHLGANSYIVKPINFKKFIEVAGQIELY